MAYSKEQLSQNLLGGSVHWTPPGDKIPPSDALEIKNFRSDIPGQLVSRRGVQRITGSAAGQTDWHTLIRRPGSTGLYVGAGNTLYADNGAGVVVAGFDGQPLGWAAVRGWLWIANRNRVLRHRPGTSPLFRDFTTPSGGTAPTLAVAQSLVEDGLEGEYVAAVSAEDDDGMEGALGQFSAPIVLDGSFAQGIAFTNIPTRPESWIAKRHLYLSGGSLGSGNQSGFWRVLTINDNLTTSAQFLGSEADITAIGIEGRTDIRSPSLGGPGPPAGLAGPYYQRLIAYATAAHPNRYGWSLIDDSRGAMPWAFSPDDWSEAGDRDGRIWWISLHRRAFVIYKEDSIWRVQGDPASANAIQEATNAQRGVLGPRAVARIGSIDVFASPDGVFTFDLDTERRISQKIDPIFKGDVVRPAAGLAFPPLTTDAAARARSFVHYAQDLLHFNYCEQGQSFPNITLVYNPQTGDWTRRQLASGLGSSRAPRSMLYNPINGSLYAGLRDGHLYGMDLGSSDHGQAIPLAYISHYHHQSLPDNDKVYEDLTLDYDTGGAAVAVKVFLNHGDTEIALGTLASSGRRRRTFPLGAGGQGRRARNVALFLDGSATSPVQIYEATIHFRIERREGRSFDTGLSDFGDDRVKVLEAIELEVEAQQLINFAVFGNLRSFQAGLLTGGSLVPPGALRIPLHARMPFMIEGQSLQLVVSSAAEFRLHKARLKLRPIGEYLVGQAGEVYDSGNVAIGA